MCMEENDRFLVIPIKKASFLDYSPVLLKFSLLIVCFAIQILAFSTDVFSQQVTVTGKVRDQKGFALVGVSLNIKGTNISVLTDSNGSFNLKNIPPNSSLVVSFVGMTTQVVPLNGRSTLNVTLMEDVLDLNEVVVTAFGIKREKKALGYAVGTVQGALLTQANESNVINALSGRVAGVLVNASSGQAGSSAKVVIRGNSSFGSNQPLYVIDGIPFDDSEMPGIANKSYEGPGGSSGIDLDANNIESITVLKGVAASALYGSKAAAGVIVVTTKNGKKGLPRVTFNQKFGVDNINKIPIQTDFAQGEFIGIAGQPNVPTYYEGENLKTSNSWGPKISDVPNAINYGKDRWNIFNQGSRRELNLTISGGTEKSNYFTSISQLNQQGILDPINFKRTNILAKYNTEVTKWLSGGFSINYVRSNSQTLFEGMNSAYSFMNQFLTTPNTYNPSPLYNSLGVQRWYTNTAGTNNYLWILENTKKTSTRDRFIPTADVKITLTKDLTLTGKVGLDYYNNFQDKFADNTSGRAGQTGIYEMQTNVYYNMNSDIMLNYKKKIGQKWVINAMVGHNIQNNKSVTDIILGKDFIIPGFASINNTQVRNPSHIIREISSVSLYNQIVVEYNKLFYYTFTGRNDWTSTLAPENRSFFYPSNSLGFIFSELLKSKAINFGKLRLSYAQAGIPAGPYLTKTQYDLASGGGITFPFNGISSYMLSSSPGNPGLQPEMTSETSIGLDMNFLQNRLGFEATYYKKISRNQLIYSDVSDGTGITGTMMNVGELQNNGVELTVFGTPIKTPTFSWDIRANYSANRNMVNKISDQMNRVPQAWGLVLEKGHPFPSINLLHMVQDNGDNGTGNYYVWDVPTDGRYGYYMRSDAVYSGYSKPVGKIEPDWYGSLSNTFTYKSFTLSALFTMQYGGLVHNMNEQYLGPIGMSVKTADRPLNNVIVWPGILARLDANNKLVSSGVVNTIPTSYTNSWPGNKGYRFWDKRNMESSDYIRLKDLTVAYRLPQEAINKIGFIKGLNLSLTGNNIWRKLSDDYTGADPDFNLEGLSNASGVSIWMMPSTKSYTLSIGVVF